MKLFIVVNVDWFFLSHRLPVALAAKDIGWDVTVVTADTGRLKDIAKAGFKVVNLPMSRSGMNPIQELRAFWFLYRLYKKDKPDVVHHVALKAILWGGIAAKLVKIHGVVNAVAGLGGIFTEKKGIVPLLILNAFRFSHHRDNLLVIFQNQEDETLFRQYGVITECQSRIIRSSGVDLNVFCHTPEVDSDKVVILITTRMIREKGIFVLVDAAEKLRSEYENKVEFWIVGGLDDHQGAITIDEILSVCDGKYIKWLGRREDVKELIQQCQIFAYPSYYREGIPKSLIEAAAIGRPIVTTDNIGCKEVVVDAVNGFLVPIKDDELLAAKLKKLINDKELRQRMGIASRKVAEHNYGIEMVVESHLEIYRSLCT